MQLNPEDAARLAAELMDVDGPDGTEHEDATVGVPASGIHFFRDGRLGNYRITRLLGSGGMGEVYEAEQDNPRRRVALKVVRAHVLCGELRRRFEHEVRILGSLHHPGIAQIYEAGQFEPMGEVATEIHEGGDGRPATTPYFAMEYVEGEALTKHAAARNLAVDERLELFLRVCQAVEHAHQRGIIHRDLKPANILVARPTETGSKSASSLTDHIGQPKVLDFGVARATDADVTLTSVHTEVGRLVGTLAYMSPEQASGNPNELDTRSDVYALGVVLYELLSGKLPYEVTGDAGARAAQALRVIKEVDPTPLSSIDRVFRGDLETIVGKALEKERERRYQSVGELAGDIRRFLADEPIVARRAGGWYELRKFARRNKLMVAAAGVAAAGVMAGAAGAAWFAVAEHEARQTADAMTKQEREQRHLAQNRGAALEIERREAARQASVARSVNEFVLKLLGSVDPRHSGLNVTVAEILERAPDDIAELRREAPEVAGAVLMTVARMYFELGEYAESVESANAGAALLGETLGEYHIEAVRARAELGRMMAGTGRVQEAVELLTRLLADQRSRFGKDDLDTLSTAATLVGVLTEADRPGDAEDLARDTIERLERVAGRLDPKARQTRASRALALGRLGRWAEAEAEYRGLLQDGADDEVARLSIETNLALALTRQNKYDEAEELLQGVVEPAGAFYGPDHPHVVTVLNNLATIKANRGDNEGAIPIFRTLVETLKQKLGPKHPTVAVLLSNAGSCLREVGRFDEAVMAYEEAIEIGRETLGESTLDTLSNMRGLAQTLSQMGKHEECLSLQTRIVESAGGLAQDGETWAAMFGVDRGVTLASLERYEAAETQLRSSLEQLDREWGRANRHTRNAAASLVALYVATGREDDAAKIRALLSAPPTEGPGGRD